MVTQITDGHYFFVLDTPIINHQSSSTMPRRRSSAKKRSASRRSSATAKKRPASCRRFRGSKDEEWTKWMNWDAIDANDAFRVLTIKRPIGKDETIRFNLHDKVKDLKDALTKNGYERYHYSPTGRQSQRIELFHGRERLEDEKKLTEYISLEEKDIVLSSYPPLSKRMREPRTTITFGETPFTTTIQRPDGEDRMRSFSVSST